MGDDPVFTKLYIRFEIVHRNDYGKVWCRLLKLSVR
jgi:hypothetical protein